MAHLRHRTTQAGQLLSHELHLQGQPTEGKCRRNERHFRKLPKSSCQNVRCSADSGLKPFCHIAVSFLTALTGSKSCGPWCIVISGQIPCVLPGFFMGVSSVSGCCKCFRASSMRLSTVPLKACYSAAIQRWRYSADGPVANSYSTLFHTIPPFFMLKTWDHCRCFPLSKAFTTLETS